MCVTTSPSAQNICQKPVWLSLPLFKTKWHPGYTDKKRSQKKVEAKLITKVERRRLEVWEGTIHSSLNVLIGSSGQAPGLNVWFAPIHADQWLSEAESLAQVSGMQITGFKSPLLFPIFPHINLLVVVLKAIQIPNRQLWKNPLKRSKTESTYMHIYIYTGRRVYAQSCTWSYCICTLSLKHTQTQLLLLFNANFCKYGKWSSTIYLHSCHFKLLWFSFIKSLFIIMIIAIIIFFP